MSVTIKNSSRRFGVELEYNALDGESRSRGEGDLPVGIYYLADLVKNACGESVEVSKWQYTNNNDKWHCKPDSSCGIEVCSPPVRGLGGLEKIGNVVDKIAAKGNVFSDNRCSLHVHVEIQDFDSKQLVLLVQKWVACELFYFLLTDSDRWLNQYCVPLGFFCEFDSESRYFSNNLIYKLSESKYFSINLYHYAKNKKKTIEFRIMGGDACLSSTDAINWCQLLLAFVDRCSTFVGLTEASLEYESFIDAIMFLKLDQYFNSNEIILWIIEKLNTVIDKTKSGKYNANIPFWGVILASQKTEIESCIFYLESLLK